jgi:hypothetical protein
MHPPTVPILNQISSVHALHPTSCRYTLILFSHLCRGLTSCFSSVRSPHQIFVCTYLFCTCPIYSLSHYSNLINLIIFDEECNSWSYPLRNLPIPLLPRPFLDQVSSSAPYSRTPSAYVPSSMWQFMPRIHTNQTKLQLCISLSLCFWMSTWKTNNSKYSLNSICYWFCSRLCSLIICDRRL